MRIVLPVMLFASSLGGCDAPNPAPEPGDNRAAQLSAECSLLAIGETKQIFHCPHGAVTYRILGNDEITGPPCFIDNIRDEMTVYEVVCPAGQRYDPKKPEQWLGLFYRG